MVYSYDLLLLNFILLLDFLQYLDVLSLLAYDFFYFGCPLHEALTNLIIFLFGKLEYLQLLFVLFLHLFKLLFFGFHFLIIYHVEE